MVVSARALLVVVLCFAAIAASSAEVSSSLRKWECLDGWNVAGWDLFLTKKQRYLVTSTFEGCKDACEDGWANPGCEFVVYNRASGWCWPKTNWKNGPHGSTVPDPLLIACRWIKPDTGRKMLNDGAV
jgi:hypothetical protein